MHAEITTEALVLRARSYGESDRIVTLITASHGKVTGIAKGAKNSRKRFAGTLEPFVRIRASFRQRQSTDLVFLLRCELVQPLRSFTQHLDRYAAGSYVLELTDRMVHGREPGGELYGLVCEAVTLIDRGAPTDALLRAFELHLLAATGYAPDLDACRECSGPLAATIFLVVSRGGVLCRACVPPGESVRSISRETTQSLARLAATPLAEVGEHTRIPPEASTVTEHLLGFVVTAPLRSRSFLKQFSR